MTTLAQAAAALIAAPRPILFLDTCTLKRSPTCTLRWTGLIQPVKVETSPGYPTWVFKRSDAAKLGVDAFLQEHGY